MQQQIQQHQRQLAQALLMKQQQTLGSLSSSGLHHGQGKSALDLFPGHPQAPGLPDLQTKEQQSSTNSYSPYPLCEWELCSTMCTTHCSSTVLLFALWALVNLGQLLTSQGLYKYI